MPYARSRRHPGFGPNGLGLHVRFGQPYLAATTSGEGKTLPPCASGEGAQDAELIPLRIRENHPRLVSLTYIHMTRAKRNQPCNLRRLI